MFELGDWTADRHREEWLEGMTPTWEELRRLSNRVWLAGALVLAAVMSVFERDRCLVSEDDILDGLASDLLSR